jgi:hypothetical protein
MTTQGRALRQLAHKQIALTGTYVCRLLGGKIVESWSNWDALGMFLWLNEPR